MNSNGIRLMVLCIVLATFPSIALASKTHVIRKNDTLYSLSKKYHVTVQDIKSANNLVNGHRKPGDKLVVAPGTATHPRPAGQPAQHKRGRCFRVTVPIELRPNGVIT